MEMLNPHCGIDRDDRGVVRLSICNAGSLNVLSSAVTDGVREGFEKLAGDKAIRAVILAGQSEKSMIGGADIKEMAKLDQKSAEAFITRLRDLCEAVRHFPAPVTALLLSERRELRRRRIHAKIAAPKTPRPPRAGAGPPVGPAAPGPAFSSSGPSVA